MAFSSSQTRFSVWIVASLSMKGKTHTDWNCDMTLTITFQSLPLKLALTAVAAALKVSLPPGTVSTHMSPMVTCQSVRYAL